MRSTSAWTSMSCWPVSCGAAVMDASVSGVVSLVCNVACHVARDSLRSVGTGGGSAMVRLQDVAEHAGVSVRTVSNVVNGFRYVAPATRERVQASIDALGYRPNLAARTLRRGRTGLVALVIPEIDSPYFAELAARTVRIAGTRGMTVLIDQTDGDAEREKELLHGRRSQLVD